jgi:signal transduction histidine kinase
MSPLSAVTLSIEEMADAREDRSKPNDAGRMKDALEKAVTASKRMGSYMESVRRHIDGGKSRGAGTEIADIDKEIAMARDIMAYKARMANVSIDIGLGQRDSTAFEKHDPITVAANPVRIHQMLLNLISNAIDACVTAETEKTGEKIVRVSASKAKERVLITVTDNGCGIPAELLKTILAKPRSTKPHGTGIGLMTVKTIVEKELGGSVEVRSTEGIGTTFIITIPAIKHEESSGNKTGPRKYRESDTPHP